MEHVHNMGQVVIPHRQEGMSMRECGNGCGMKLAEVFWAAFHDGERNVWRSIRNYVELGQSQLEPDAVWGESNG